MTFKLRVIHTIRYKTVIFESIDASIICSAAKKWLEQLIPQVWMGMTGDACVLVTRMPPETYVPPLPSLTEGYVPHVLKRHPLNHYLHVISLLPTNIQEYVSLALVTLPVGSLPKLFFPLQPWYSGCIRLSSNVWWPNLGHRGSFTCD